MAFKDFGNTFTWVDNVAIKRAISDKLGKAIGGVGSDIVNSFIYRYPLDHEWNKAPYMRFSCWKPTYNQSTVGMNPAGHICMYMPIGVNNSDNAQWEMASSGIVGAAMKSGDDSPTRNAIKALGGLASNVKNAVTGDTKLDSMAVALGRTYGDELTGIAAGGIGALSSTAGAVLAGGATYGISRQAFNELSKDWQVALNPREFMLYRAPGMRTFSYDFRFIPSSEKEAADVLNIIKYFRTSMYPELTSSIVKDSTYAFPHVWSVKFENVSGIPNVPPCALTNVSVTYNPNSMSFYANSGVPVEIVMQLQLQELAPINRKHVEDEGY